MNAKLKSTVEPFCELVTYKDEAANSVECTPVNFAAYPLDGMNRFDVVEYIDDEKSCL